jgi:2-polyprenyl-3-methyl-5-hydroxy-6-metoxy-1,4-benzoquinol methylase
MSASTVNAKPRTCPLCAKSGLLPDLKFQRVYAGQSYSLQLGKCPACGFVQLLNDPQVPYDDTYIHQELSITLESALVGFAARERLASVVQCVPPGPEKSFLDIGMGDGLLLSLAERAGYATFGLDVNPSGVALARDKFGLRAEISLEPLPRAFPERTFDVIHLNEVIEHIPDPMAVFHWCRQRLAPSGYLVVQTGNITSLASRLNGDRWDYLRPMHVSYFSTRTLQAALHRAGFQVARRGTVDWRFRPALAMARQLAGTYGLRQALNFSLLFATARVHGIRRTVLIYAR